MNAQRIAGAVALTSATILLVLTIGTSVAGQAGLIDTGYGTMGSGMMGSGMMGGNMMGGSMMGGGTMDPSQCPHATTPPAK